MFGCAPKIGLASGKIPDEVLRTLLTEEDLESLGRPQDAPDASAELPSSAASSAAAPARSPAAPARSPTAPALSPARSSSPAPDPDQPSCSGASATCAECDVPTPGTSGLELLCALCQRAAEAKRQRTAATDSQRRQAAVMLRRSRDSMSPIAEGANVRLGIPDVDRSRDEHRNLICVVLEVSLHIPGFWSKDTCCA